MGNSKRNLGILGCAALLASACGDDGSSAVDAMTPVAVIDAGSADAGEVTRFVASWTLLGGCQSGDEVEFEVASTADGRVSTSRFPCTDTSGTSEHVGLGTFDLNLRVIDTDFVVPSDAGVGDPDAGIDMPTPGALVAASDPISGVASVLNADTPVAFSFPTNTASITVNWSFNNAGFSETCALAGAVNVDLEYELLGVGVQRSMRHPCGDLTDESGDLATGVYVVRAKAVDGADADVRPELISEVTLFVGNEHRTLGLIFTPDEGR